MSQASLFDSDLRRVESPAVGKHHRDAKPTELRAAKKQVQLSGKRRLEVLKAIVSADGISRHDISDKFGIYLPTVCGRVRELLDGGWVYEKGESQGRSLLFATDRGQRAAASPRSESRPAAETRSESGIANPRQGRSPVPVEGAE